MTGPMTTWWETCSSVTWLNFFLAIMNAVSKYSTNLEGHGKASVNVRTLWFRAYSTHLLW